MPEKRGPKAPFKLTPDVIQKLEITAAKDCTYDEMALYAGISRATLYDWMSKNPELKERLDRLRAKPMLKTRDTIVANLGDIETAKWYAERKAKREFGRNLDLTTEGKALPTPLLEVLHKADKKQPKSPEPPPCSSS